MYETQPTPVGGPPIVRTALFVALVLFIVVGAAVAFGATPLSGTGAGANASPAASSAPVASAASGASAAPSSPGTSNPGGWPGRGFRFFGPGYGGPGGYQGPPFAGPFTGGPSSGPLQITITDINGNKIGLKTADGWARTIDAGSATITRNGQAIQVSDLKVGDTVLISEQAGSDGTYTVTAITVVEPHVTGTVQDVSGDTFTVKSPDGTTTTVTTTDGTTYTLGAAKADKSSVVQGANVDVTGTKSGNTFTADAVRVAPSTVSGLVTKIGDSSITVTQRDGSSATINVTSSTTYHVLGAMTPGGPKNPNGSSGSASPSPSTGSTTGSGSLSDIAVGDTVLAQGTLGSDGSLTATDVWAGKRMYQEFPFGGRGFGPGGPIFGPGPGYPAPNPGASPST